MKNIFSIVFITITTLTFTACGGGGSSSTQENIEDPVAEQEIVDITISCVDTPTSNDFDTYITLYGDDEIINDQEGTLVTTYHNIDGEKKVCLNSGAAHIVRK